MTAITRKRAGVTKPCAYCGTDVYRQPCYANSQRFFCSPEHNTLFMKQEAFSFNCSVCNKVVYTQPTQIKYRNRKTCSLKCRAVVRRSEAEERRKTYTKHQLDRLARYSPEAKEWRVAIFERDNYTCGSCGERGGYLEADHIKPWAYFPDLRFELSNGRTLCRSCHGLTKMSAKRMREIYGQER